MESDRMSDWNVSVKTEPISPEKICSRKAREMRKQEEKEGKRSKTRSRSHPRSEEKLSEEVKLEPVEQEVKKVAARKTKKNKEGDDGEKVNKRETRKSKTVEETVGKEKQSGEGKKYW